jgi:hypothetical protein
MESTWLVAAEHDEEAFERLEKALRELGYELTCKKWGVGGSQELSEWVVTCPGGSLQISAETCIGLAVSGRVELISDLQSRYGVMGAR